MIEKGEHYIFDRLDEQKDRPRFICQIDLTYRCNLNCVHCYCKGSEDKGKELTTGEWKKTLNKIRREGCLYISFSGGDPLVREDFLELYSYAKEKGFLVSFLTNGVAFTEEILRQLQDSPPHHIEITINGITQKTYESITQTPGSFEKAMFAVEELKKRHITFFIKTNFLKLNKQEITKVKLFTEKIFGKGKSKYYFRFDQMIYPRLNGDLTPCKYRLSFEEMLAVKRQDADIWKEFIDSLRNTEPACARDAEYMYHCNSWMRQFVIDPFGKVKVCGLSEKYRADVRSAGIKKIFNAWTPKLLGAKFKPSSRCRNCNLRALCNICPSKAYLETGNEESPIEYYCQLAQKTAAFMHKIKNYPNAKGL